MKKSTLRIRFVRLNDFGVHLLVKAKINGKAANMLIDTGASNTVFDKTRISLFLPKETLKAYEKLSTGLGTSSMKSESAMIRKLEFGDLVIVGYKAVILDLSHVNHSYKSMKMKPIDGVLGGDILKSYAAVIDYGKKTLLIVDPAVAKEKKKSSGKKKKR